MSALVTDVPDAWRAALAAELASPTCRALEAFLHEERARGAVFPPREEVFAALRHVAPGDVRAVILGQDPYPTAGNAHGLAFSVRPGVRIPASLRNVFAALAHDTGLPQPTSGDLTPWARAGVLLLNTVLTVREGAAGSHRRRGWESLTTAVLRAVVAGPAPVVFLALGEHARALVADLVDRTRHPVLELPHPSPLNGKAFVRAADALRPFSRTNELLVAGGRAPIDWRLP